MAVAWGHTHRDDFMMTAAEDQAHGMSQALLSAAVPACERALVLGMDRAACKSRVVDCNDELPIIQSSLRAVGRLDGSFPQGQAAASGRLRPAAGVTKKLPASSSPAPTLSGKRSTALKKATSGATATSSAGGQVSAVPARAHQALSVTGRFPRV